MVGFVILKILEIKVGKVILCVFWFFVCNRMFNIILVWVNEVVNDNFKIGLKFCEVRLVIIIVMNF